MTSNWLPTSSLSLGMRSSILTYNSSLLHPVLLSSCRVHKLWKHTRQLGKVHMAESPKPLPLHDTSIRDALTSLSVPWADGQRVSLPLAFGPAGQAPVCCKTGTSSASAPRVRCTPRNGNAFSMQPDGMTTPAPGPSFILRHG